MRRIRFDRTQMEGAAAEIRFLPGKPELTEADAVHVWEGLDKAALPIFERQTMNVVNLTLKPTGHDQTHEVQQGWVMASTDRRTAVSLYPSVVAVQTANYDHYRTSLGDPLTRVLQTIRRSDGRVSRSTHRPQIRESVAELRSRNAHLLERARTRRVCWSPSPRIAPLVEALHQQVQLRLDDTAAARYRVAFFVSKPLRLFIAIWWTLMSFVNRRSTSTKSCVPTSPVS